jgi:hypothetical protein
MESGLSNLLQVTFILPHTSLTIFDFYSLSPIICHLLRANTSSSHSKDDYPSPLLHLRQSHWQQMGDISLPAAG